jgi:acetolactate decarboxylase
MGFATSAQAEDGPHLTQVGTYDYLTQPDFEGLAVISDVLTNETIGLGTFTNLDGELVMVGGTVFQVKPDGTPRPAAVNASTPFLQAIRFRPEVNVPIPPGTECANLIPLINAAAQSAGGLVAVRVRGTFTDLTTRSVTADPPPYQPLASTVAEQTVFPLGKQRAALVGFRQGDDALGLGQPGLHLHGLTGDRSAGGHVLSCTAGGDVQLSIQRISQVQVNTPR